MVIPDWKHRKLSTDIRFKSHQLTLSVFLLFLAVTAISCRKETPQKQRDKIPVVYNNVLILGNSITYTPANPSLGWFGNWGMAASVADSDYVHLLTVHFKSVNKAVKLTAVNIVPFEFSFSTYDFDASLKTLKDTKPDLLIVRIGENITTTDSVGFDKKYTGLLDYFKSDNPALTVLAVGPVWGQRDLANNVMSKHSAFITLISLQEDQSNFAYGLFTDPAVQVHPDDKGMRSISNQIWAAVQALKTN